MERTERRGAWTTAAKVAAPLLAGLVVLVLLFPASGDDSGVPQCYSMFNYAVPCGGGMAVAAGAVTSGVVGLLLWIADRRKR